jgi:hypothetical protein
MERSPMTENRMTHGMLSAYADREPWMRDHEEAMSCLDLEEKLVWGMTVFRTMNRIEAGLLERISEGHDGLTASKLADIDACYRLWLDVSEDYLAVAQRLLAREYEVNGLDEFRATVEEARAMVGNNALEGTLPSLETLEGYARPENPDPSRYGS